MDTITPNGRSLWNATLIIGTCFLAITTASIGNSAVSMALPDIGKDLNIDQDKLQWVASAYELSAGCFLLLFGRLADIYGRKLVFLLGTAWWTIFGLGCGFAQNQVQLNILRGLQGAGSAAVIPAAIGILAYSFPPSRRRSIAFSVFSAGNPFGGGLGMTFGGVLTQFAAVKWRGIFFVSAGLGALSLLTAAFIIDRDEPTTEKDPRVDWIGAALVTSGLILIIFVLGQGPLATDGFRTPYIIALLILGVFLIVGFIAWEHYLVTRTTMPPLMQLELWKRGHGKFSAIQGIAFLEMCAFMSWNLWTQLYYQTYKNYTPVQAMLRILPMAITGLILNILVGFAVGLIDILWLLVVGTMATGSACLLFAIINPNAVYWAYGFPAAILSVGGADFIFAGGSIFVARVAKPHEQSVAGGVFQTVVQLGTAFGLAITTIVHNTVSTRDAARDGVAGGNINAPPTPSLNAYKAAQWTGFGFAMTALLISIVFLRGVGIVGDRGVPQDESQDNSTPTTSAVFVASSEVEKSAALDHESERRSTKGDEETIHEIDAIESTPEWQSNEYSKN